MPKRTWDINELRKVVSESITLTETLRKLGLRTAGDNYETIRNAVKNNNIDISHFDPSVPRLKAIKAYNELKRVDIDELLVENSNAKRATLKRRLIKENILENKCAICGQLPIWCNKTLVLQLDHTNGVYNDNRKGNLRLLCPNCHSQTKNFAGRSTKKEKKYSNKYKLCPKCRKFYINRVAKACKNCSDKMRRKVIRPTKIELKHLISTNSWVSIGRKFGVSDNAVRKWARRYNLL